MKADILIDNPYYKYLDKDSKCNPKNKKTYPIFTMLGSEEYIKRYFNIIKENIQSSFRRNMLEIQL